MASRKPIPGIMTVLSDVIKPALLSRQDFDTWYSDEHIPDVVSKSGVSSACRYEHKEYDTSLDRRLGFLTVYQMPDIGFMESEEFRSLEGQRPGKDRERIFEKAEFDTRSYVLVQEDEAASALTGPAPFLVWAAMEHEDCEELDKWYREEHLPLVRQCPGYRRSRRYKLASSSLLSLFERSFPETPTWLVIYEFDGPGIPWEKLRKVDEMACTKVNGKGMKVDFREFRLKGRLGRKGRDYEYEK